MKAHIICNNDGVHHVVISKNETDADEKYAKSVMERIKKGNEERITKAFGKDSKDAEYHITASYWHIHEVTAEEAPEVL